MVLWVVMPCNYVVGYQIFGGPCCTRLRSEVKKEAAWTFESLVPCYITTWYHNPEDHGLNFHQCKNLKSVIS